MTRNNILAKCIPCVQFQNLRHFIDDTKLIDVEVLFSEYTTSFFDQCMTTVESKT